MTKYIISCQLCESSSLLDNHSGPSQQSFNHHLIIIHPIIIHPIIIHPIIIHHHPSIVTHHNSIIIRLSFIHHPITIQPPSTIIRSSSNHHPIIINPPGPYEGNSPNPPLLFACHQYPGSDVFWKIHQYPISALVLEDSPIFNINMLATNILWEKFANIPYIYVGKLLYNVSGRFKFCLQIYQIFSQPG